MQDAELRATAQSNARRRIGLSTKKVAIMLLRGEMHSMRQNVTVLHERLQRQASSSITFIMFRVAKKLKNDSIESLQLLR